MARHIAAVPRACGTADAAPFSIEVTPRETAAFGAVVRLLPRGTEVFVANLPDQEPDLLVDACARYRDAGFRPVPHLVARNIEDATHLRRLLSGLTRQARVERALVLGGDRAEPVGPFEDALGLLETGSLQEHGIRSVAFACFPEGHPRLSTDRLRSALEAKLAVARRDALEVLLVSQFLFEAEPLLDYARRLRGRGIAAPLRVGVAGPADAETLLKFADELGVGASKHVVAAEAVRPETRQIDQSPRALLSTIVAAQDAEPALGVEGFHFFAFGSTAETIVWAERHRD